MIRSMSIEMMILLINRSEADFTLVGTSAVYCNKDAVLSCYYWHGIVML
jgi:hypothetical protein